MVTDEEVLAFFRHELSLPVTWRGEKIHLEMDTLLQDYSSGDELPYAVEDYGDKFGVDISKIDMHYYFPWENTPFSKRMFKSRKCRDEIIATRKPLTVRMFAESAKAGHWLYD
ncbi:DUF1493 family protein [Paramixta manurensis]|uniref:DUF1493 family protein n=1 Tax=Paramixta manurensis TaxID=2740817 RepID=A0A6M8UHB4_9GAMM|nr:DUF1493 family protein [Erwiniaceae bacterium PD-1]